MGNWPALFAAGFTDRLLAPWEEDLLLARGYAITNLVARTTATAVELSLDELRNGKRRLARKVRRYTPRWVAIVGIGAYRVAFQRPDAIVGRQQDRLGDAGLWLLPNPSGLNANHQPAQLARLFRALRSHSRAERDDGS